MTRSPFPAAHMALLLDFDGTLVDIAPTPESVVVPDGLGADLLRLRARLKGALAIVTGRPIVQIDHFLPEIPFAVAGEHGATFRFAPDAAIHHMTLPVLNPAWREEAEALVARFPGARVEPKRAGLVLHYRAAPEAKPFLLEMAGRWNVEREGFRLQRAKMAFEIRPVGIDKGQAVRQIMKTGPFVGRLPVFVGDDLTDGDGVAAARALGGTGWLIPEEFPDAAAFRAWLHELAGAERWDV